MNKIKKLFSKFYIKIIMLVIVFLIVVGIYFLLTMDKESEISEVMGDAKLPVITMTFEEEPINILHGYTSPMDAVTMRDSLTPLGEGNTAAIEIDNYGTDIKKISYEVRSIDYSNLVEKGEISKWDTEETGIRAAITLDELIQSDQEYILLIKIKTEDYDSINYYTRILKQKDSYIKKQIDFVTYLNEAALNKEDALASYLEPDASKNDNTNLGFVTINSSNKQVSWGELTPKKVTEPVVTVKEAFGNIGSFELKYIVSADNNKVTEYYNVTEFYRVNIANDTRYLLDYERTVDQIFSPSSISVTKTRLNLGIDSDLQAEFKTDSQGNYVCFAKEGDVWCMNTKTNEIISILSFRDAEYTDMQNNYDQHDAKIVHVDDEGNVEFLLYGYMNRGKHEGSVGAGLYRYTKETNSVEEITFIPSSRPYQILSKTLGKLFYVKGDELIYIMIDDSIYSIDVGGKEYVAVASGLKDGNYVISYNSDKIAWNVDGAVNTADEIRVLDLGTGESQTVLGEDGKYIKALGFLGEAFVYGVADTQDLRTDGGGTEKLYMNEVRVIDKDDQIQRTENTAGIYYLSASSENNRINLERVQRSGEGFTEYSPLAIYDVKHEGDTSAAASLSTDTVRKQQVIINFVKKITASNDFKTTAADKISFQLSNDIEIKNMVTGGDNYYVYGKGKVLAVYDNIVQAIQYADAQSGVVVDENQKYVWIRGIRKTSAALSSVTVTPSGGGNAHLADAVEAVLKFNGINGVKVSQLLEAGESALSVLNDNLDGRAVDLTGCTLDQMLYFISSGQPVIGVLNGDAVLITGYDAYNVILVNMDTGETYKQGISDTQAVFSQSGSSFISIEK